MHSHRRWRPRSVRRECPGQRAREQFYAASLANSATLPEGWRNDHQTPTSAPPLTNPARYQGHRNQTTLPLEVLKEPSQTPPDNEGIETAGTTAVPTR